MPVVRTRDLRLLLACATLGAACAERQNTATVTCEGPGCVFQPGDDNDPVLQFALKGGGKKSSTTTTITNPDGSITTTVTTVGNNGTKVVATTKFPDGSSITVTTVTHKNGKTTTSVRAQNPQGQTIPPPSCTAVTQTTTLVDENFHAGADSALWPKNIGWDGDFNDDWFTDGTSARPNNPLWGFCPQCKLPVTTGFWKTIPLCAEFGARISMVANVDAAMTSAASRTTLVLYFFDAAGNTNGISTSWPRFQNPQQTLALYDAMVPPRTTKIIVAPMAYLAGDEKNSVFYFHLTVTYEPPTVYTPVSLVTYDDFSSYGQSQYGADQPTGWGEFGGDWMVLPSANWATLWNAAWGGATTLGKPPVDTGMTKTFTLGSYNAGDVVDLKAFAATNFTDATSLAQLRLIFNDAKQTTYQSQRLVKSNWDELYIRRVPIPAGATTAEVVVNAYLGPSESSSMYLDNLYLTIVRP